VVFLKAKTKPKNRDFWKSEPITKLKSYFENRTHLQNVTSAFYKVM